MSEEIVKVETPEVPAKVEEPKQPPTRGIDLSKQIEELLPTVGSVKLTKEEKDILFAPVDASLVEIRQDGIVYLPWMEYVTRLRDAIGIEWGLIAIGFPKTKGESVVGYYAFIIRQTLVGFFFGEQLWSSSNRGMSWTDAVEGARSNALMRACKALGITLELWNPSFVRAWKSKFAVQMQDSNKKTVWVKREFDKESEILLLMTAEKAVEATKEMFPGAEVVETEGAHQPDNNPPDTSPSALLFVKYHDEMVRLNHYSILHDWWTKHGEEAELKLHPNHYKQLVELKNKLRQGFIDKKMKEKGGK
jgi:hypothetical protein